MAYNAVASFPPVLCMAITAYHVVLQMCHSDGGHKTLTIALILAIITHVQ